MVTVLICATMWKLIVLFGILTTLHTIMNDSNENWTIVLGVIDLSEFISLGLLICLKISMCLMSLFQGIQLSLMLFSAMICEGQEPGKQQIGNTLVKAYLKSLSLSKSEDMTCFCPQLQSPGCSADAVADLAFIFARPSHGYRPRINGCASTAACMLLQGWYLICSNKGFHSTEVEENTAGAQLPWS